MDDCLAYNNRIIQNKVNREVKKVVKPSFHIAEKKVKKVEVENTDTIESSTDWMIEGEDIKITQNFEASMPHVEFKSLETGEILKVEYCASHEKSPV